MFDEVTYKIRRLQNQPGERPVTARSGDVSSTRQHCIMGHATEEENTKQVGSFSLFTADSFARDAMRRHAAP